MSPLNVETNSSTSFLYIIGMFSVSITKYFKYSVLGGHPPRKGAYHSKMEAEEGGDHAVQQESLTLGMVGIWNSVS